MHNRSCYCLIADCNCVSFAGRRLVVDWHRLVIAIPERMVKFQIMIFRCWEWWGIMFGCARSNIVAKSCHHFASANHGHKCNAATCIQLSFIIMALMIEQKDIRQRFHYSVYQWVVTQRFSRLLWVGLGGTDITQYNTQTSLVCTNKVFLRCASDLWVRRTTSTYISTVFLALLSGNSWMGYYRFINFKRHKTESQIHFFSGFWTLSHSQSEHR